MRFDALELCLRNQGCFRRVVHRTDLYFTFYLSFQYPGAWPLWKAQIANGVLRIFVGLVCVTIFFNLFSHFSRVINGDTLSPRKNSRTLRALTVDIDAICRKVWFCPLNFEIDVQSVQSTCASRPDSAVRSAGNFAERPTMDHSC